MMLNAWHLPVPPFVKQSKDQLLITLWLTGEDPPQRIMLRTEHDNEETSVPMHKQRSQPHGGRRSISPAGNLGGVIVSNCCGTIASVGLHRRASAECRQHDWSSLPSMYRISAHNGLRIRFFIRSSLIVSPVVFLVKLNRIMFITITQPDKRSYCVTGMNRSRRRRINVLWRRSGRYQRKTAVSEKTWRDGAVS